MRTHHDLISSPGFSHRTDETLRSKRSGALAGLIAMLALAVSTIIAVTAVSIGIARADPLGGVIDNEGGLFAIALLLGIAGMTCVGAMAGSSIRRD